MSTTSAILVMLPLLSLMPATFGWAASATTQSVGMSTGTNFGTLYSTTGTGDASATAEKKALSAALVMSSWKKAGGTTSAALAPAAATAFVNATVSRVELHPDPAIRINHGASFSKIAAVSFTI